MSIKTKLYAQARTNAGLLALLDARPNGRFNWYDTQLQQGASFPAVVVQVVSNARTYAVSGRLPTSFARVQFTVYGTGNDSQNADQVVSALADFFDSYNGTAIVADVPVRPNTIIADRDGGVADTQPLTYTRIIDAMLYDDETV